MGSILYWLSIILIILWLIGFLGFHAAVHGWIHLLLVLVAITFIIRMVKKR